jgi:hypothetical protein
LFRGHLGLPLRDLACHWPSAFALVAAGISALVPAGIWVIFTKIWFAISTLEAVCIWAAYSAFGLDIWVFFKKVWFAISGHQCRWFV